MYCHARNIVAGITACQGCGRFIAFFSYKCEVQFMESGLRPMHA